MPPLLVILISLGALLQTRQASALQFRGLIELDHGSSIVGMPRHSRYIVEFDLEGSVLDTDHTAFANALVNANGVNGITMTGSFPTPFRFLRFTADPSGPPTLDLSGLNFDYNDTNGSAALVTDVNQPPDPQAPPCDVFPCINEHITLSLRDLTPGAAIESVWFNLYNSTFYDPIYATRQELLDTSTPSNGFTFSDLFLHGPQSLAAFRSYRQPNFMALRDGVFFDGPNGTLASGRFLSLTAVPSVPAPVPCLGALAALRWGRRLRRRLRAGTQAPKVTGELTN
jgi:hypothetical protein